VAEALIRVGKRALKGPAMVGIAIAAFVAIAFLKMPFPSIVIGAALIGLLISWRDQKAVAPPSATDSSSTGDRIAAATKAVLVWGLLWLAPVAFIAAIFGGSHVFVQEALFFSKVAVVTFGGAYAVLAYVAQQAVENYHWLRPDEMLTGLGFAETTPGPLILVLVFVGFLAGARGATGLDPILAGTVGAFVTLWVTFAPSFLFIFAGAPFIERLRDNRYVAGALAAVTAAVVGVIANLALWFGLHVLFGKVGESVLWPLSIPVPVLGSFDFAAALIALAAGAALIRLHANVVLVLMVAALSGAFFRLLV